MSSPIRSPPSSAALPRRQPARLVTPRKRSTSLKPAMTHKVRITPEAEADLRSIGDYIADQNAPDAAIRFVKSLRRRIASLKTYPEGYGLAPEAQTVGI